VTREDAAQVRAKEMLVQGWTLLGRGRGGEAGDLFGRVLLGDQANLEARRGLELSRAAAGEADRIRECLVVEAEKALNDGQPRDARRLLDGAAGPGGGSERALALEDRVERLLGRVASAVPPRAIEVPPGGPGRARQPGWSRALLTLGWTLAFTALGVGITLNWESFMRRLVRTPAPTSRLAPPTTHLAAPTPGEEAVAQARRLMERGDWAGALAVLDRVPAAEPAYPFACRLREDVKSTLAGSQDSR